MLAPFHVQLVEYLGRLDRLALWIQSDTELAEDIFIGANQHELGALTIEKRRRIRRHESAPAKSCAKLLRQISFFLIGKAHAPGGRVGPGSTLLGRNPKRLM